jgi:hypothetical protein
MQYNFSNILLLPENPTVKRGIKTGSIGMKNKL